MKSLLIIVIAVITCFAAYAGTDVRAGVWTAELQDDHLEMTVFHGQNVRGGMSSTIGFDEPLSSFAALSKSDLTSPAANVHFELRRPAGTIAFEGRVANGSGAGHYRFMPSESFVREMDELGYPDFKDEQLLMFAVHNFSPQTIRDLRAMGYEPTKREVEEIAIFRITPEYLREMENAGYPKLSLREAVNFRVGRVDAAYIKQMRELGYTNLSARQLADAAILGITPAYIRRLAEKGYKGVPLAKLVQLHVTRADEILFK